MKNLICFVILISLTACGLKVNQADNATDTSTSGVSLLKGHSFATVCSVISGADQINRMTFNASGTIATLNLISYESSDASCTTEANVVTMVQTPVSVGAVAAGTGQTTFDGTFTSAVLTPSSAGMATIFNGLNSGAGLCNINTWASGTSEDIASCFGLTPGTVKYGTIWITGSAGSYVVAQDTSGDPGGCGANDNSSSTLRCTTKSSDAGSVFYEE